MSAVFPGRVASRRWLFGVCSRLQHATGINALMFRLSFVIGAYLYTVSTLLLFALLVVVMRTRGGRVDAPLHDETVSAAPKFDMDLHGDIKALQLRLAQLEAEALSKDRLTARRFKEAGL